MLVFNLLQFQGQYADCQIEVVDSSGASKSYSCHKIILTATSGFFRDVFNSAVKTETTLSLEMSHETFESILRFTYAGEITVELDQLEDVKAAMDKLLMTDMVRFKSGSGHC